MLPATMCTIFVDNDDDKVPFGAKGVAEVSLTTVPAAIAAALNDAVGIRPREASDGCRIRFPSDAGGGPCKRVKRVGKDVRVRTVADAIAALRESDNVGVLVVGGLVVSSFDQSGIAGLRNHYRYQPHRRSAPDQRRIRWPVADRGACHSQRYLKIAERREGSPVARVMAKEIACERLRNQGTIGGSLCMIGQQGDPATGFIALGAELHIQGPGGQADGRVGRFLSRRLRD